MKIRFFRNGDMGEHSGIKMMLEEAEGATFSYSLGGTVQSSLWTLARDKLTGFNNEIDVDGQEVMLALEKVLDKLPNM